MTWVSEWVTALSGVLISFLLNRFSKQLHIPRFPWQLASIALVAWAVAQSSQNLLVINQARAELAIISQVIYAVTASRLLVWLLLELLPRFHLLPHTPRILRDVLFIAGSGLLIIINLRQQSQIDLIGLVTTSAVLTAVLGLAAQDPLKDFIGGLSIQLEQVIKEGDWVEIDDQVGQVTSISWRDVELRSRNGSRLVMPHTTVSSSLVRNFTSNGIYGNRLFIGLDYGVPPEQARQLMLRISEHHPLVLKSPASLVRIHAFDESSINYEWLVWQESYEQELRLRGELKEQLWYALGRAGLSIPFPVRDVRLHQIQQVSKAQNNDEENAVKLVQCNSLFAILSSEQQQKLVDLSAIHSYGAGEIIVGEDEPGDSLFILLDGKAKVSRSSDSTNGLDVADLYRGDIFGEMTLFTAEPRNATVRSISEVEVLEVSRNTLAKLMEQKPELLESFGRLISLRQKELKQLESQVVPRSSQDVIQRMRKIFSQLLQ